MKWLERYIVHDDKTELTEVFYKKGWNLISAWIDEIKDPHVAYELDEWKWYYLEYGKDPDWFNW